MGKLFRSLFAVTLVAILSACGGGGGSAGSTGSSGTGTGTGTGTGSSVNGSIQVQLFDSAGLESNRISGTAGLNAKAVVRNSSGASVGKGVLVTFTLDNAIAVLSSTVGTALTGDDGVANIGLKAGVGSGAGTLTASAMLVSGGTAITGMKTFEVSPPASATPVAINFLTAVPADKSIVIKGTGGNGRSEVAILTFIVVDSANAGIPNAKVNFSTVVNAPVVLGATSGTTDSEGKVTITVSSGDSPTTVRVKALVDGTSIAAISDTVTVTTSVPTQDGISLSVSKDWVEGGNFDNQTVVVEALLVDKFGGAVADNTQIVFTTTAGGVLGLGGAQCQTNMANITGRTPLPGACSIFWRSQNPRSNGVANIIGSATSATGPITDSTRIYVLGSFATIYRVGAADFEGSTVRATTGGTIDLDFTSSCNVQPLNIEIVDSWENPMPPGSLLSIESAATLVVSGVSPATVPHWNGGLGMANPTVPHRGTVHLVNVQPTGCNIAATTVTEFFNIVVTTPAKIVSSVRVTVRYKK